MNSAPQRTWTKTEIVDAIREEPEWETCADLAAKYGVCAATISNIRTFKTHGGAAHEKRLTAEQRTLIEDAVHELVESFSGQFFITETKIRTAVRRAIEREAA